MITRSASAAFVEPTYLSITSSDHNENKIPRSTPAHVFVRHDIYSLLSLWLFCGNVQQHAPDASVIPVVACSSTKYVEGGRSGGAHHVSEQPLGIEMVRVPHGEQGETWRFAISSWVKES